MKCNMLILSRRNGKQLIKHDSSLQVIINKYV